MPGSGPRLLRRHCGQRDGPGAAGAASGGNERAERARPLGVEQSNTSIVYDDRLILKLFRRLSGRRTPTPTSPGPGCDRLLPCRAPATPVATGGPRPGLRPAIPCGRHRRLGFGPNLAPGLYGAAVPRSPVHPGSFRRRLRAEACRLGQMTAEMHLAMAEAFGVSGSLGRPWRAFVDSRLEARTRHLVARTGRRRRPLLERLRAVRDPGPAVRVHGRLPPWAGDAHRPGGTSWTSRESRPVAGGPDTARLGAERRGRDARARSITPPSSPWRTGRDRA